MVARGARLVLLLLISHALSFGAARWPEGRVAGWSGEQSWRVGSNYVPASAINQLEIWQEDSFDPARIELELGTP